jgi:hypothetical protein
LSPWLKGIGGNGVQNIENLKKRRTVDDIMAIKAKTVEIAKHY